MSVNETPVDLAAVQADDALLDMLGGGLVSDSELARVLAAWRRDVDSEPVGELVDPGTATAAITAGRKSAPRGSWVGLVSGLLALAVIAVAGLGVAAVNAQPGDLLWPVHELLYPEDGE